VGVEGERPSPQRSARATARTHTPTRGTSENTLSTLARALGFGEYVRILLIDPKCQ